MARKQAEAEFARMCKRLGIWAHKWMDVRVCPRCRLPLFVTNRDDGQEEMGNIVDYLIFIGSQVSWVEVKGMPGHTRLPFSEISDKQRDFLDSFTSRHIRCFLFISLGDGRAPVGRKSWLVEWEHYLSTERNAVFCGQKSLNWIENNRTADRYTMQDLTAWELTWIQGGWTIPEDHPLYLEISKLTPF